MKKIDIHTNNNIVGGLSLEQAEITKLKGKLKEEQTISDQLRKWLEQKEIPKRELAEAKDKLDSQELTSNRLRKEVDNITEKYMEAKDKLSRRNMQIKDLKAKLTTLLYNSEHVTDSYIKDCKKIV